ncbi:hypothetical protein A2U01_0082236, partial [Trifolium medium]|nr:hypothetical protein [Trifolium medium]
VDPDAAPAVLPAVVVAVVLLLLSGLPLTPSLPFEKMYDLEVTQRWLSVSSLERTSSRRQRVVMTKGWA